MMLDHILSEVVDGKKIVALSGAVVPAPPHAELPGNHLFVNCLYGTRIEEGTATDMLQAARADLPTIIETLQKAGEIERVASVCVTFLAGARTGPGHRFYRYCVSSKALVAHKGRISEEFLLCEPSRLEMSDIEQVASLLSNS